MRSKIDDKSQAQGFQESRLPQFSAEDSAMIYNSSDFLGINFYTSNVVYTQESDIATVDWSADQDVAAYQVSSDWLTI